MDYSLSLLPMDYSLSLKALESVFTTEFHFMHVERWESSNSYITDRLIPGVRTSPNLATDTFLEDSLIWVQNL